MAAYILLMAGQPITTQERPSAEAVRKPEPSAEGWRLVWADEFNEDGRPDSRNWTCETGFVRNHEFQWYQPDNAWCEKGLLIIEGRKERKRNPNYDPNGKDWKTNGEYADYTSTSMTTRGLHSWQFGRFEMRGRIDTRPGLWPAFWTLGVNGAWPSNGEIDIMEYYRGLLLANAAWGTDKRGAAEWDAVRKPITEFNDPEWSKRFHVWKMDWDEHSIKLYVDDLLLNEIDLEKTFNKDKEGKNPFRQPHFILLNLAIGGSSGGDPSPTQFPARFEVDYVRVFKKQP
ncbi:MAG TPA: glycoside hydrolase family 16 protein [Acidobacteriota bacterium]|nr:glycoside hydrolase family 16 protein [Acidobacteriota bacterium]